MCLLGNITITEANVRQNTGKEKQSKKELPDIQTGSFHIHYCIFKRQILTAHFCSARKERDSFSFFWFVLHQCMNVSFLISAGGQQKGTIARWNVKRSGGFCETGRPG